MARSLPRVLQRVHKLAAQRQVHFTRKALRELYLLDLALDERAACELLEALTIQHFVRSISSTATGELMHVFKPEVAGVVLYLKLILRNDCIVVSFHEDTENHGEEDEK